jgi:hypothetical protein
MSSVCHWKKWWTHSGLFVSQKMTRSGIPAPCRGGMAANDLLFFRHDKEEGHSS